MDGDLAGGVGDVIEVAIGVRRLLVDRRRDDAPFQGERGRGGFEGPDAPIRWPTIDFCELIGIFAARWPKTRLTATVSIRSFSRVLVPWALM